MPLKQSHKELGLAALASTAIVMSALSMRHGDAPQVDVVATTAPVPAHPATAAAPPKHAMLAPPAANEVDRSGRLANVVAPGAVGHLKFSLPRGSVFLTNSIAYASPAFVTVNAVYSASGDLQIDARNTSDQPATLVVSFRYRQGK